MEKKLYRSSTNRVLAGVCGGVGEYFGIDPVMVRILMVIFTLMGGSGLLAYIIAAFVIPGRRSEDKEAYGENYEGFPEEYKKENRNTALVLGLILISIAALIIFRHFVRWIPMELVFAGVLVIIGGGIILSRR
jgi:phage shock protein C